MAQSRRVQTSFNGGVMDPRLAARLDLETYFRAMQTGKNVLCMVQGGVRRRPGLKHIDLLPGVSRLAPFEFSTSASYLVVFSNLRVDVYQDGALLQTLVTPWLEAELGQLRWAQSDRVMIVVHENHAPRRLARSPDGLSWVIDLVPFDAVAQVDYNDADSPTPTPEIQTISFSSLKSGDEFVLEISYSEGSGNTESIQYSTETATMASRLQNAISKVWSVGGDGVTVVFAGDISELDEEGVLIGTASTYTVTFGGGSAKAYDLITGYASVGAGTVNASTRTQAGVPRTEDVWSAVRGWPKTVCFHQGRLVFGGTKSLPQSIFASRSNVFFDFKLGESLDDDAIFVTLDTNQLNAIQHINPSRHLQVFTTDAEFYLPGFPWTPSDSYFRATTQHGVSLECSGLVSVDGATLFVERKGKVIRQFVYADIEDAYVADAVSMLSSHLIRNPVDVDVQSSTGDQDSTWVYFVNSDGTIACLTLARSEKVNAWTLLETNGAFKAVAVVDKEAYFAVERNGAWCLEHADFDYHTDAAGDDPAQMSHLEGRTVRRVGYQGGNPLVLLDEVVTAGAVSAEAGLDRIEIGLGYDVEVELMPAVIDMEQGPGLTRRTRIIEAALDMYETLGLVVAGQRIPNRRFDVDLDSAPEPYTGVGQVQTLGWGIKPVLKITSPDPLPMTVLAVDMLIEANSHGGER